MNCLYCPKREARSRRPESSPLCRSGASALLGDRHLAIVVPGRMFKAAVARTNLSQRILSRTLKDCGTLTAALIPWTGCGAFPSSALDVPTLA